jgi:hypothetical protein
MGTPDDLYGCKHDDRARLLGTPGLRDSLVSWNGQGFLAWDPDSNQPRNQPQGMSSPTELVGAFQNMVTAAREDGCGYEAVLESWYRFLIDPEPPERVVFDSTTLFSVAQGIDATILEQRAQFLRPDSLVAVIMLSDENDCSLTDYGRGGTIGTFERMPRANGSCERDVNDPCCAPCDETPAAGCPATSADPICSQTPYYDDAVPEHGNLRCYRQKQRFGRDFLQPLSRYVDGLTQPRIYNRRGELVENPLFRAPPGGEPRDRSLVYLAGITGVPWQDISDKASWSDPTALRYLTYRQLEDEGRWDWILGKDGAPPLDPLMLETPFDRSDASRFPGLPQEHPAGAAVGGRLASSESTTLSNPINGHESKITDGSELQYACIFPLSAGRTCDKESGCDCSETDAKYNRALCQGTTQTHAKAFPGTRQLEVLRDLGKRTENAIVASICPKVTQSADAASDPSYGYNPAVSALIERLKERIGGKCLPRPLQVDPRGQVPCVVVEARKPDPQTGQCGPCDAPALPGRTALSAEGLGPAVRQGLERAGSCGLPGEVACNDYCLCEVQQFEGTDLERCRTTPEALRDKQGYCYVDESLAPGEAATDDKVRQRLASIAECPATQRRLLRFSSEVPAKGAVAFIGCLGKTLDTE